MFENINKTNRTLLGLFLVVLIVLAGATASNQVKRGHYIGLGAEKTYTIFVSGEGKVDAKPDLALVDLTVWTEGWNLNSIQQDNAGKMNQVTAFLKDQGIKEKDIKTARYDISPRYDYTEKEGRRFRGYKITQTLEVKIREDNFSEIGNILNEAVNKGANDVGSLSFTVEEKEEYEEQARKEAIKEAKKKAKELASELGVGLGRLTNYSESGQSPTPRPVYMEKSAPDGGGASAPNIEPGTNEMRKNVTLTYEIVD